MIRKRASLLLVLLLLLLALPLLTADDARRPVSGDVSATIGGRARDATPVRGRRAAAEEDGTDDATAPSTPRRQVAPWRVLALGPGDRPLADVLLGVRDPEEPDEPDVFATGEDGRVEIPRFEGEATLRVHVGGVAPQRQVVLNDAETVLRFPGLLPLTVTLVDAETGHGLTGGAVAFANGAGAPVPLARSGDGFRSEVSPLRSGELSDFLLEVSPPEGFVGRRFHVRRRVSAFAEGAHVAVALQPELRLTLDVRHADGRPAKGARLDFVYTADGARSYDDVATGADGTLVVRGTPFVRNAGVTVRVFTTIHWAEVSLRLGEHAATAHRLRVDLPAEADEVPCDEFMGVEWGDPDVYDHVEAPRGGTARLEVTALRSRGAPAANALVFARGAQGDQEWRLEARADARGLAVFEGVPEGAATISVEEPGYVYTERPVRVRRGATEATDLLEADGETSVVTVVDDRGRPLPTAEVRVVLAGTPGIVHLEDGVQHLVRRTDAAGRRRIGGLPAGRTIHVEVFWDTRWAKADVRAGEPFRFVLGVPK